ncbi:MAG: hypothetical protein ACR2MW_07880 [Chthoniobacterales bacterium]
MEPETPGPHYHGFWPVFLIGMSIVLILVWEIQVSVFTRRNATALKEQQVKVVDEAKKVQGELEKIARGLVELSKTDAKAQQIVTKFGIKVNNPTVPTETPAP